MCEENKSTLVPLVLGAQKMKKSAQGMVRRTRGRGIAGLGNDVVLGGDGHDALLREGGNDVIFGGVVGMRFMAAVNDAAFEVRSAA